MVWTRLAAILLPTSDHGCFWAINYLAREGTSLLRDDTLNRRYSMTAAVTWFGTSAATGALPGPNWLLLHFTGSGLRLRGRRGRSDPRCCREPWRDWLGSSTRRHQQTEHAVGGIYPNILHYVRPSQRSKRNPSKLLSINVPYGKFSFSHSKLPKNDTRQTIRHMEHAGERRGGQRTKRRQLRFPRAFCRRE